MNRSKFFNDATILVTGGAGFIGGCFVRQLLSETQCTVINLDKLTYAGNLDSLAAVEKNPRHIFVCGDIGDRGHVARLLEQHRPTAVVNFAAESHVDRSIDGPRQFVQTNVLGTFELLQVCLNHWQKFSNEEKQEFRFLHVSTDEVYGSLGDTGAFKETTPYAPNSPYSASKAAADHFVRAFHHTYGLPVLTTNCSNNYGPYQFPEKLIPLMILNAIEGRPLPVYGDGGNVRDWLHVQDHCHALRRVLEAGKVGEVYNIGGNCERTNLQVVHAICNTVDQLVPNIAHKPCSTLIRFVTDRPGHDRRYAIDSTKIQQELGWTPQHDFESGILETVRWYIEHREWIERVTSGKYRRERLGLSSSTTAKSPQNGNGNGNHGLKEFRDGSIDGIVLRPLKAFADPRGWLMELYREDDLADQHRPVMTYVSETKPGVVRGPHEHVDQSDYFAFIGPGDFELYLWDARQDSATYGNRTVWTLGESNPGAVIIPPGVVHAYKNVAAIPGWVFNAPDRLYRGWGRVEPVDEIRHEDVEKTPFVVG